MSQPIAYLNGEFISIDEMKIPVGDSGFMQGVTVAEQMRTFGGELFRLEAHLARLRRSLDIIAVELPIPLEQLGDIARQLVSQNRLLLADGDDLAVSIFVTPGPYAAFASAATPKGPTIGIHTCPIAFGLWADKYETGQHLVVSRTRQISTQNWPAELKCRSRMHYYLADCEARNVDPEARALLLDLDGYVSEASTANVLAYFSDRGLVSPPQDSILPGISLAMLQELADELSIPFTHERLTPQDFASANEVLLCSTSPCVLPVTVLNGTPIADGKPGDTFRGLLNAWSQRVGLDIAQQARKFAQRR